MLYQQILLIKDSLDGEVVAKTKIDSIDSFMQKTVSFGVQVTNDDIYYVMIKQNEDLFEGNNSDYVVVNGNNPGISVPSPTPSPMETATPAPTEIPTKEPTVKPTAVPTSKPTAVPTLKPTAVPTLKPTATPSATPVPTLTPTSTSAPQQTVKPDSVQKAEPAKLAISAVKCKRGTKLISGKMSVAGARVKIKVGNKSYKNAVIKGRKFTLKVPKLKKKTKIKIMVTKAGYKKLVKVYKVK